MQEEPAKPNRWTIRELLRWTADYFATKGVASPRLDAEVLLAYCLDVDRLSLYVNLDRPLNADERGRYRELVRRRAMREPVALITGRKEFWSFVLRIPRGVLIPRPETEILVEAVLEEIRSHPTPNIMEIGTGSGAVSIATARETPRVSVVATDIDLLAITTAHRNAVENAVAGSILFVATDLFAGLRNARQFDVVCSNPPYIESNAISALEPEITLFEPRRALDGGRDGLSVIRRLASQAPLYLKEKGALIIEIGDSQEKAVREAFHTLGHFSDVALIKDLAGKPRVIRGRL